MRNKNFIIILILTLFLIPFNAFAAGGFSVSTTSVTMHPGESKTITISSDNSVGKLNISSSNAGVASVSIGSVFIQTPGSSQSFTITANAAGSAIISVVASSDYATMDEEILAGQTKQVVVNIIEKQTSSSSNNNNSKPSTNYNPNNNLSNNNKLKSLKIEGYNLEKIDESHYELTVNNNIKEVKLEGSVEDSKATIKGLGTLKLEVGENLFDVVVTSESGAKNKISVKITRKDGFYLEDIKTVLDDKNIEQASIIINLDEKISKENLKLIKENKKTIEFNYYNEDKNLVYSWIINGTKIKNENEFTTKIEFTSTFIEEIGKLSNYAEGKYVHFEHSGKLPTGTKVKILVDDKFKDGSLLNVYYYDNKDTSLELIDNNVEVKKGYVEISLEHCSDYFITRSNLEIKNNNNLFIILITIELIVIVVLVILDIINKNPLSKITKKVK